MSSTTAATAAYTIRAARPADNAGLLQLLRGTPMGGDIEVTFMRQPDYFLASRAQGRQTQVFVGLQSGRIVCTGTRALRRCWINGEEVDAGYLADLRLAPAQRGGSLIARSYRFLREQHADGRARMYCTVIVADNTTALKTIAANRKGMPRYTPLGKLHTPMLHVRPGGKPALQPGETIERCNVEMLPEVVSFLNASRMQMAEVYTADDFTGGRFTGFSLDNLFVLRRDGELAGVLGMWNQQPLRQTVICGYNGWLKRLLPLVNLVRRPQLPAPGETLNFVYAAFRAAKDQAALRTLLEHVLREASRGGHDYVTLGVHEDDPLLQAVFAFRHTPFAGRLFAVTFNEPPQLDGRTPFVEAATL